jgi:very-short-patch-repair endonuclease
MTQQELDAALSLRFRAGLARFAESAEAALPYATVEEALADEEPTAAAAVQVLATAHVRRLADEVNSQPCGSPLERVMLHALLSVGTIMCDWGIAFASCAEGAHEEPAVTALQQLTVCCQHIVKPYRADFLLTFHTWSRAGRLVRPSVVVEVDGHNFHERTKEQARHDRSRDRAMQESGLLVFRFTGSEVFADPIACAAQAVRASMGIKGERS